jgi:cytochrome c oxidase subunit 1
LAYWLYLFGGLVVLGSFLTPAGAADFGWTAYTPLSDWEQSPGVGGDMWIAGLVLSDLGTILGSVNMTPRSSRDLRGCRSGLFRFGKADDARR